MKVVVLSVWLVSCLASVMALAGNVKEDVVVAQSDAISIAVGGGDAVITGWDKDAFSVEGSVSGRYSIVHNNGVLAFALKDLTRSDAKDRLRFFVPKDAAVTVTSTSAQLSISDISGKVYASSVDGAVDARGLYNTIDLKSVTGRVSLLDSSGDIKLESVSSELVMVGVSGAAELKSFGGDLRVDADLSSLRASNTNGKFFAKNREIDNLQLSSVNGDIVVDMGLTANANIAIETVGGSVALHLPEAVSADFALSSHQGGVIENTFSANQPVASGGGLGSELRFKSGDGSASVVVNTLSGGIELALRKASADAGDVFSEWESADQNAFDFAYFKPDSMLSTYREVYISPAKVAFGERWLRTKGKRASEAYLSGIKERYAETFRLELVKQLEASGDIKVVAKRNKNALVLLPKIEKLEINVPDTPGFKEVMAKFAGYAVVDLTFYSPREKAVVGLIVDRSNTPPFTASEALSRMHLANERSFRKLFKKWSKHIVKAMK